eukprot:1747049-Amphidinium_carterae.2
MEHNSSRHRDLVLHGTRSLCEVTLPSAKQLTIAERFTLKQCEDLLHSQRDMHISHTLLKSLVKVCTDGLPPRSVVGSKATKTRLQHKTAERVSNTMMLSSAPTNRQCFAK